MNNTNIYMNYGDRNFFEGGLYIMDCGDGDYEFIKCDFANDSDGDTYLFSEGMIDPTDSWIDIDAVSNMAGAGELERAELARAIIDYYGPENCSGHYGEMLSSAEVQERMNGYAQEYEFEDDSWSAGPLY